MKPLPLCLTAGLLLSWADATYAQRNFDDVEIKSTHVGGKVHMLEGAGGNIGVSVGPDGLLIIDDQFAPLAEKIEGALDDLEQIQADGVPERWNDWGWGFIDNDRWLEILYNSLN